jgi:Fe2+ or Zn2+ uptake regulation protein
MRKYKELITNILRESDSHLTAEEIFFRAKKVEPSIALATVYNNLNALRKENEIRKISVYGQPERYDKTAVPHAHLICQKCQKITDAPFDDFSGLIEKRLGINVTTYDLNVYYICENCRKTDNKQ